MTSHLIRGPQDLLTQKRRWAAAWVANGTIYVVGGSNGTSDMVHEIYDRGQTNGRFGILPTEIKYECGHPW